MWLLVRSGEEAGRTVELAAERVVVGREEGCELVLASDQISRRHAAFERLPDGRYSLSDLGSANGTFVGGQRLTGPVVLEGGEEIRFANTVVAVARTEAELAAAAVPGAAPTVVPAPAPAEAPRSLGPWVRRNRTALAAVAGVAALAGLGAGLGIALTGGSEAAVVTVTLPSTTVVVTEAAPPETAALPPADEPPRETTPVAETEAPPAETEAPPAETEAPPAQTDPPATEAEAPPAETGAYETLLGHIPAAIRETCFAIDELPQDAIAGANCGVPGEGMGAALYFQFASAEVTTGWYERNFVNERDVGDCVADEYSEGVWSIDEVPQGRLACGVAGEWRAVAWTTDSLAIGVVALKEGGGEAVRQELYDFWLGAGPE
ncbi:MAG: FHA domain-containing protein [Thermoleophilia bacterium]|nr:FHA domain-containing protein [Thermoleophilia bacterium]